MGIFGRKQHLKKRDEQGFTLLELLVVLAVIMVVSVGTLNLLPYLNYVLKLEGGARQLSNGINQARLEALKRTVRTVVEVDLTDDTIFIFADVNGVPGDGGSYLVFDPDPGLEGTRLTDYEIADLSLPEGISFGGPTNGIDGADSTLDLTARPAHAGAGEDLLVFESTGSLNATGAFRVTDSKNLNHLELALINTAGKSEIRKFLQPADQVIVGMEWYKRGNDQTTGEALWKWYS